METNKIVLKGMILPRIARIKQLIEGWEAPAISLETSKLPKT